MEPRSLPAVSHHDQYGRAKSNLVLRIDRLKNAPIVTLRQHREQYEALEAARMCLDELQIAYTAYVKAKVAYNTSANDDTLANAVGTWAHVHRIITQSELLLEEETA